MSNMSNVLKIFIAILLFFCQISEGYSEGQYVTKILGKKECYIKAFPIVDEKSIKRQSLELLEVIDKRSKNASTPAETVTTVMKVIREIPREELSSEVLEFCGKNTAYEVEEKIIPLKKEKSFTKRSALPVNRLYRKLREKKSVRPNGYLTCKNAKDRDHAVFINCLIKGKTPPVGCKPFPTMRRYQATCKILPAGQRRIPSMASIRMRGDLDGAPIFNFVDTKCAEQYKFTASWCCDVLPCD